MKRRNLLLGAAAAGASLAAAVAVDSTLSATRRVPTGELRTEDVGVRNEDSEPHAVTLIVRFDGEVVHQRDYRLGTRRGEQSVLVDVPDRAGEYHVTVEMDGEVTEFRSRHHPELGCAERVST